MAGLSPFGSCESVEHTHGRQTETTASKGDLGAVTARLLTHNCETQLKARIWC
jgi:hypothetical protein